MPSEQPKQASKKFLSEGSLSLVTTAAPLADQTDPGEREICDDPNPTDPAATIVEAWVAAYKGTPPPLAPDKVRSSARELLAEGKDAELLRLAAADMAPRGWKDFRTHLEHWAPPVPKPRTSDAAVQSIIDDCRWCDDFAWYETESGKQKRCRHPENPPAGHPAAGQPWSAA